MPHCAYCGSWTEQVSQAPCPSCGKPSNGAPVHAIATGGGTNPALIVVGVIVAVLFGVAILGIVAAIAIPNFINAKKRAEQKRTMADIRVVATAIEAYATDNNIYPKAESVAELEPFLVPKYIKTLPRLDGWGNEIRYHCTDEECKGYGLSSAGSDRIFEKTSAQEYTSGSTSNYDCDIVYVDGRFLQYPEGRGN